MKADERDQMISMLTPEAAAELIEEAPAVMAVTMIEGLDSSVAVKIMEELQTVKILFIFHDLSAIHKVLELGGPVQ